VFDPLLKADFKETVLIGPLFLLMAILFTVACNAHPEFGEVLATIPAAGVGNESKEIVPDGGTPEPDIQGEETGSPPIPTAEPAVASSPTVLPSPEFTNPAKDDFRQTAERWGAEYFTIDMENTGLWQYHDGVLVHPIALAVANEYAYLLDSGRIVQIDLQRAEEPLTLLSPGDEVDGVLVLEPLDLAFIGEQLLVLDRAGDVYAYDFNSKTWQMDRYDRPVEESSGHYFVALAGEQLPGSVDQTRALLETNYKFAQLYDQDQNRIWRLPEQRAIDLDYSAGDVYILQRELHDQQGHITKYRDTSSISSFAPRVSITEPRQIIATTDTVYVLDQEGRRLLVFEPQYGQLLRIFQLPQDHLVTTAAVDPASGKLFLAGQDRLYHVGDPSRLQSIAAKPAFQDPVSHDPLFLATLDTFIVPIGGSNITFRDFQLPGAPRHYRLGVHNGIDLYWQPGTKVLAAGEGTVIRADLDYIDPTAQDLDAWYQETRRLGHTSKEILDNYMGRQVWIEHEPGIVTRYAHLRSIEPGIATGKPVSRGEVIGEVGNSGSPASLEGEAADAHLHYELWINGSYFGRYLRPIETRDWSERMFPVSR
jgi:murein DD-endopeptidase MepM/ murein hydrolase activator NlpD